MTGEKRAIAPREVVAVREASRQHDCGRASRQLLVGVPHERRLGAEALERERDIAVVVRPRKDNDGDPRAFGHPLSPNAIS